MNRRPWPVVLLLVLAVAGCGASPTANTEQRPGELEEIKADRDRLAALVQQLAATLATLEAYTINNRRGCLDRLRASVDVATTLAPPLRRATSTRRMPHPISAWLTKAWTAR